jgi:hypothetical protein
MNRYKPATSGGTCACFTSRITGEPYSGNLYLRFDEDLGLQPPRLLYRLTNPADFTPTGFLKRTSEKNQKVHAEWQFVYG